MGIKQQQDRDCDSDGVVMLKTAMEEAGRFMCQKVPNDATVGVYLSWRRSGNAGDDRAEIGFEAAIIVPHRGHYPVCQGKGNAPMEAAAIAVNEYEPIRLEKLSDSCGKGLPLVSIGPSGIGGELQRESTPARDRVEPLTPASAPLSFTEVEAELCKLAIMTTPEGERVCVAHDNYIEASCVDTHWILDLCVQVPLEHPKSTRFGRRRVAELPAMYDVRRFCQRVGYPDCTPVQTGCLQFRPESANQPSQRANGECTAAATAAGKSST